MQATQLQQFYCNSMYYLKGFLKPNSGHQVTRRSFPKKNKSGSYTGFPPYKIVVLHTVGKQVYVDPQIVSG